MNTHLTLTIGIIVLSVVIGLATGGSLSRSAHAQSGSTSERRSAVALTIPVALRGYSPVSYLDKQLAEPGSARYVVEHDGAFYLLTSEVQVRAFESNPERYLPAYGGYCAFGCSVGESFVPDPESFEIIEGRTHLFLKNEEVDAKKLWNDGDERELRSKADAFWRKTYDR